MAPRDAELELAVARAGFPPGETGFLAMLVAYFDESGTNPGSRLMTMVGVMATPKRWRLLSREWWRILRENGVRDEYKADECVRGLGQYETWGETRRLELRALLGRLIDRHVLYATVVSMPRDAFQAVIYPLAPVGHLWRDPYPWALRSCLEFIAKAKTRKKHRVACVVDEGHGAQSRFFDYFPSLKHVKGWGAVFMSLTSAPSHQYAPLQVAEWLVYECRHDTDQWMYGTLKKHRGMLRYFQKLDIEGGHFTEANLRDFMREVRHGMLRDAALDERANWEMWLRVLREEGVP